jgi:two-component system cell cycle sensor histidine kinase/response regulator CckA
MDATNQQSFDEALAIGSRVALLAEDELITRNVVLAILQRHGFAVLVAVDGEEALELARAYTGSISLLVTDMQMPRMGGAELATLLQGERPELRVIQMSGKISQEIAERNRSIPFIQKPFLPKSLTLKIDEVLRGAPGTISEV